MPPGDTTIVWGDCVAPGCGTVGDCSAPSPPRLGTDPVDWPGPGLPRVGTEPSGCGGMPVCASAAAGTIRATAASVHTYFMSLHIRNRGATIPPVNSRVPLGVAIPQTFGEH